MEDAVFKASFEQVPLNVQSDRIARGRHSLEVCLGFFNDRATVQDRITQQNYRGVEKARGGDAEMKGSSVRRGIEITMGTWSATAGENSGTLALNLRKKVCEPLEQVLASQRENNVRIRARWQQVSRRVKNCEDQLASAKVRLSKSQADRRKAAEAHLLAQTEGKSGLEKLEGRLARATDAREALSQEVRELRRSLHAALVEKDDVILRVSQEFEAIERQRLHTIATSLKEYVRCQMSFARAQLDHLCALDESLANMDPDGDLDAFIMATKDPDATCQHTPALQILEWARPVPPPTIRPLSVSAGSNGSFPQQLVGKCLHDAVSAVVERSISEMVSASCFASAACGGESEAATGRLIRCVEADPEGTQEYLLRTLNERRAAKVQLSEAGLDALGACFVCILNRAFPASNQPLGEEQLAMGVPLARRIMIIAQTYYCTHGGKGGKIYLQSKLKHMPIWHSSVFWDCVLTHALREELHPLAAANAPWDEMGPERRADLVLHVNMVIFSQLISILIEQADYAVPKNLVTSFIQEKCSTCRLSENHRESLQAELQKRFSGGKQYK